MKGNRVALLRWCQPDHSLTHSSLTIVKLGLTRICKQNQLGSSFFPLPLSFCTNIKETVWSSAHRAWELSRTYESSEARTVAGLRNQLRYKWLVWWGQRGGTEQVHAWRKAQDLLAVASCGAKVSESMPQFLQLENKAKHHFLSLCRDGAFWGQPEF